MSLLLRIEEGPHPQAMRQARLDGGEIVIGRGAEADWQIDDPEKFVSRAHCRIRAERDGFVVTDMSSSGLYIDEARAPLGAGNSAWLRHGMRLRLGEYVLGVDIGADEARAEPLPTKPQESVSRAPIDFSGDDFFSSQPVQAPKAERPADLPDPFDAPPAGAFDGREAANVDAGRSPGFDDPFSLDPVATPASESVRATPPPRPRERDPFATGPQAVRAAPRMPRADDFDLDAAIRASGARPFEAAGEQPFPVRQAGREGLPWEAEPGRGPAAAQSPAPTAAPVPRMAGEGQLHAAFLRGLGLEDVAMEPADAAAQMERFGREYRLMMDGLHAASAQTSRREGQRARSADSRRLFEGQPVEVPAERRRRPRDADRRPKPRFPRRRRGDHRCRAGPGAAPCARVARRAGGAEADDRPLRSRRPSRRS